MWRWNISTGHRIATLINQNLPGQQTTTLGAVIFTKADRQDINTFTISRESPSCG